MRIGEAHPAEPVIASIERIEPGYGAIGNPIGVVPLLRDRVVVDLRRPGLPPAGSIDLQRHVEHRVEHRHRLGMVVGQPAGVVQRALRPVRSRLEVLETSVQPGQPFSSEAVLDEPRERIEERLEVRLADQRRAVSGVVQHGCDRRGIDRQGDAVHPHTVRARMLAGDDGRSRRHAHDRLRVGALVSMALRGESVDHRGARHGAAVAAQRVVALLVGGDEQDLAAHQIAP